MVIKTVKKEKSFIPKFNGNSDLPKGEQIVVSIKNFPTIADVKSYTKISFNSDNSMSITYPNDAVMLSKCVGAISNIEIEGEEPIVNGSDLAKSSVYELSDLVSEIRDYLVKQTEVLPEKEK